MNADRIAEIRERLDKATPGPWAYNEGYFGINANGKRYLERVANANGMADTRLIAHAPDDLAFLLDLVAKGSFMPHIPESQIVRLPPPNDDDPAPVPSGEVETPDERLAELRIEAIRQRVDRGGNVVGPDARFLLDELTAWKATAQALEDPVARAILLGEVETPCATCGGTRRADWSSDDYVIPCPDCGVETPEAAAAGHSTPELIAFDRAEFRRWWAQIQVGGIEYQIACPDEVSLIAQGWTSPGTEDAK